MCSNLHMTSWGPLLPIERQKLRRLRLAVPLSLSELAERAGCSVGHLRRIETTFFRPSGELATRIAHVLSTELGRDVSPSEFYEPRDPRPRRPA